MPETISGILLPRRRMVFTFVALLLLVNTSCERHEPPTAPPATKSLQLLTTYSLSITEPSGLAYSTVSRSLYMISDNRAEIFKIDTTGRVLASIPAGGQDVEGVAVAGRGDTLYIVEETLSQVTTVLANGTRLSSFPVTVRTDPKHALEGVTIDNHGHLWVINEKAPMMLLAFSGRTEIRRQVLDYSSDISDICYDGESDSFWIVSDESQKVLKLSPAGALLGEWSTPVPQGEGIALIKDRLYIVSDVEAKLYIFSKPQY